MIASRILAVLVVLASAAWIVSGQLGHGQGRGAAGPGTSAPATPSQARPPFRVGVVTVRVQPHRPALVVSGRTEADRRARASARTNGVVERLLVRRGDRVAAGDVVAALSDEARDAAVARARAKLEQKRTELEARAELIRRGTLPTLNRFGLEAEVKAAEADLALAEAEFDRSRVRAPIAGIVSEVWVEVGQALQTADRIAEVVALDPMLAVIGVAERNLGIVTRGTPARVRLVDGRTAEGMVRYVSPTASETTRTYRVEIVVPNQDGLIPDGITAEVAILGQPLPAVSLPRVALTFAGDGRLGVRSVVEGRTVFRPVTILDDQTERVFVAGIPDGDRVIVQGQDFVGDGERVEAVDMPAQSAGR
jgi:multidrug efflux system membrane fusion protein